MNIVIRLAEKQDYPRLFELIKELAKYEKSAHKVRITLQEFEEAGFGLILHGGLSQPKQMTDGVIHGLSRA